ncbi:MAG: cyclic nucleotide-binding domain-containing protein [Pseudomonadota bacterium]
MDKIEILQKSPLFEKLLPAELETLAELTQPREYESGEVIIREGDAGDALYILVQGEVEVLRRDPRGADHSLAVLTVPDFFGEMSLIDKEHRSATVRTRTRVTALTLTAENLHSFAKVYREGFTWIAVNIAKVLSHRLRETNRRLSDQG